MVPIVVPPWDPIIPEILSCTPPSVMADGSCSLVIQ
jgi:hypothetical protein